MRIVYLTEPVPALALCFFNLVLQTKLQIGDVVHVYMVVDIRRGRDAGVSHEILRGFQVDALTA